ncbi:hypothetical protein VTI74DRAFT_1466 [Chaetomium olivicolor]
MFPQVLLMFSQIDPAQGSTGISSQSQYRGSRSQGANGTSQKCSNLWPDTFADDTPRYCTTAFRFGLLCSFPLIIAGQLTRCCGTYQCRGCSLPLDFPSLRPPLVQVCGKIYRELGSGSCLRTCSTRPRAEDGPPYADIDSFLVGVLGTHLSLARG